MDKVAEFINTRCYRQALARLCRLANKKTATNKLVNLGLWENTYLKIAQTKKQKQLQLRETLEKLDKLENMDQSIPTDHITSNPLLWLTALDIFIHNEVILLNPAWLTATETVPIDDGEKFSYVLPIYRKSKLISGFQHNQFQYLNRWLNYHRVVQTDNPQDITVVVHKAPSGYRDWLRNHFSSDHVNIAVSHFDDRVKPVLSSPAPELFICEELDDNDTRLQTALSHIIKSKQENAQILVMPELSVTPLIRKKIIDTIHESFRKNDDPNHDYAVPIIVLGSFHEQKKDGWCNHGLAILGYDGTTLFECDKHFPVTCPDEKTEKKEMLEFAGDLFCSITPIGLMSMAICKDIFAGSMAALLAALPLDWLLVPSMSNELNPHKRATRELFIATGMITVVANQEMPDSSEWKYGYIQHEREPHDCTDKHLTVVTVALK